MGIFSWLRSRRSARHQKRTDNPDREHNLVRYRYDDPKLERRRRAAAEDIARVEEDDKHHRGDTTPGER